QATLSVRETPQLAQQAVSSPTSAPTSPANTATLARTPAPSTPTLAPQAPTRSLPSGTKYAADWSAGLNGWPATNGWSAVDGELRNDGSDFGEGNWISGLWNLSWVAAPFAPADELANYTVEAEIQVIERPTCGSFGLVARGLYQAGVHMCGDADQT